MANTIQHRRDTAANWTSADPTLAAGEFGFETDTGKFKLGDGSTAWSSLAYFEPAAAVAAWSYGGENYGYAAGGVGNPTSTINNGIQKYSYTSDGNAANTTYDLNLSVSRAAGSQSSTSGYLAGSQGSNGDYDKSVVNIQKFGFADSSAGTDVGDLTVERGSASGHSSETNGYTSGGFRQDPTPVTYFNTIDKFPFSADANATDVGDLLTTLTNAAGASSSDNGYVMGGANPVSNVIQKFPFSSDASAADVGDLTVARTELAGQSSSTNGYASGGITPTASNVIDKFPFASDANATDVGDLVVGGRAVQGTSSTTNGYTHGGAYTPAGYANEIEKFSFSADGNATDVGDLAERWGYAAGVNN